jgi:hypothetical protein
METQLLKQTATFQLTEEGIIIEVMGEYNSYVMDVMSVLDTNCARIVERGGNYFVITFGRVAGRNYEDTHVGPFASLEEAREQATVLLEDFEG